MNSDVSFNDSEPGPAASMPGESALLPAAVPPGRARGITSREYRQGMVVTFDGRRWEIDSVEFWRTDQKLHLHELDGAGRVRTREEWARNVEFEGEQTEPAFGRDSGGEPVLKVCPNCGKLGSESHLYDEDLHHGPPAWTCRRPEVAAPVNGSTPIGEYDPEMQPAAQGETPEAVSVNTFQLEDLLKYADLAEVSLRTGFSAPAFLGVDLPRLLRSAIESVRVQLSQAQAETAWLVEHPHDPRFGRESWYCGAYGFTIDSLLAIRFARKEDACREIYRLPYSLAAELVATEHRWVGRSR